MDCDDPSNYAFCETFKDFPAISTNKSFVNGNPAVEIVAYGYFNKEALTNIICGNLTDIPNSNQQLI
jgi:hypothetical protein